MNTRVFCKGLKQNGRFKVEGLKATKSSHAASICTLSEKLNKPAQSGRLEPLGVGRSEKCALGTRRRMKKKGVEKGERRGTHLKYF